MFTIGLSVLLVMMLLAGLRPKCGYINHNDEWIAFAMVIAVLLMLFSLMCSIPAFLMWTWRTLP